MNWRKWIIERIPARLRVVGLIAVCMALTVFIRTLYEEFVAWQRKMRIKVSGTPQVCMLQKIIRDELGLDVLIEEGDGKPTDFIIKTSFIALDKERQLFALIDRYKLAGKSYMYANTRIAVATVWSGMVCELAAVATVWSGMVCERRMLTENLITAEFYPTSNRYRKMVVTSQYPTVSDIDFSFTEIFGSEPLRIYRFHLPEGFGKLVFEYPDVDIDAHNAIRGERLSILNDYEYEYSVTIKRNK